jgi:hypothetical protein
LAVKHPDSFDLEVDHVAILEEALALHATRYGAVPGPRILPGPTATRDGARVLFEEGAEKSGGVGG